MNKLLVITGASSGIGRASAQAFVDNGYEVINISRRNCDLPGVHNLTLDLTQAEWPSVALEALQEAASAAEQICLVHNAAALTKDSIDDLDADHLRYILELNVVAPQRLNAFLLPLMKTGSSILYVNSTLGEKAVTNAYSYVVSKHAGIGMMKANCQDLAGRGIHTLSICPGFTDTEMLRAHVGHSDEVLKDIAGGVLMGRLIEPEEIAAALLFGAQSPVLNGSVIHANLGQREH